MNQIKEELEKKESSKLSLPKNSARALVLSIPMLTTGVSQASKLSHRLQRYWE